ncbi:uncharacterized protein LOC143892456 [Tasmannia lanceolata]|uniref:uncharacterized protein LOC143892456 n=1 Tax=Tasmannia lanceolata TaxID=3420 RepID=UPI004064C1A2
MEGVVDTENGVDRGGMMGAAAKEETISFKTSTFGGLMRKRLSDITNTHQQRSSDSKIENQRCTSFTSKDYIDQLHKEKTALLSLLAERNKYIELSSLELHKLRFNLQKTQQQNWQLAKVNSQMLAELNLGKDKLKALRHEFGCTVAVLKAKNLELEEKLNKPSQKIGSKLISSSTVQPKKEPAKCVEVEETSKRANTNSKPCNLNRRRQSRNQSSSDPSTMTEQVAVKENVDNKRICLRRRSSTYKSNEPEPTEDLFEIEDAKFPDHPPLNEAMHVDVPPLVDSSSTCSSNGTVKPTKEEEQDRVDVPPLVDSSSICSSNGTVKPTKEEEQDPCTMLCQTPRLRRSLIGRPLRRAAEKVCSYKEKPLNVKMRR